MKDPGLLDPIRSDTNGEDQGRDAHATSGEASGLSRRGFLRGSGLAAAATALSTPLAEAVTQAQKAGPSVAGPAAIEVTLTINGQKKTLKVEPRVTLLDAMRNHLDLTGAKKVCDRGTCGACTVMIDKKPAYACSVLAIDAQGREIKTVESLGADHPMVKAFVENDAQQCGFCTPGFVMACTAFAMKNPGATLEQIESGLGGNLCRCGTYMGIKGAVQQAAKKVAALEQNGGSVYA
jgi:xanthine dehydrogenase YagT iron-sulfur-binding subunit